MERTVWGRDIRRSSLPPFGQATRIHNASRNRVYGSIKTQNKETPVKNLCETCASHYSGHTAEELRCNLLKTQTVDPQNEPR